MMKWYWAVLLTNGKFTHHYRETVELLLSKGADPNIPDEKGDPPLYGEVLVRGRTEVIDLLLTYGANPNARIKGATILHWFIIAEQKKPLIELLIANGADVNAKDEKGRTPLELAREKEMPEIVDLLVNYTEEKK